MATTKPTYVDENGNVYTMLGNIRGPAGKDGSNGIDGKSIYAKTVNPWSVSGWNPAVAGDLFLNTTTGILWSAKAGAVTSNVQSNWTKVGELAGKITVDSALSSTSTNPVQNKVINDALGKKANISHSHSSLTNSSGRVFNVPTGGNGGEQKTLVIADDLNAYQPAGNYASSTHKHPISDINDLQSTIDGIYTDMGLQDEAIAGKADSVHTHEISNINGLQSALNGKSNLDHNHDSVYQAKGDYATNDTLKNYVTGTTFIDYTTYIEGEVNKKANASHDHDISDINGLQSVLDGKSNTGHGHAISDITNLQSTLNSKLNDYGSDTSRPGGTTFTFPGGSNPVQMRSGNKNAGRDIGIFSLTDDNAFICNSSDNGYAFAVFDTDQTADFSSASNAAFAVLSDHSGVSIKGGLTVGNISASGTSNNLSFRHIDGQNCNNNYDLYLQYHQQNSRIYLNGSTYYIENGYYYNGIASQSNLINPHQNVTSTDKSTWDPTSSGKIIWGQKFANSAISNDTGDLTLFLRPSVYSSGATELCMNIDGDYYSMGTKISRDGHTHTKSEVGLGNVDNTADANKNVNYATSAGNADALNSLGRISCLSGTSRYNSGLRTHQVYSNGYPFTYGSSITIENGFGAEIIFNGLGGGGNTGSGEMQFRTHSDWDTSEWGSWRTVIDSSNIGSQNVNYANSAGSARASNISMSFSNGVLTITYN